tara:strand:- start:106 stop:438 length:333 start_codon:yes stop_codon:yes gene_type:complete
MEKREKTMKYNETIFGTAYMIGVDEGAGKIKNINLIDFMRDLNFIDHPGHVNDLAVVWYEDSGDIHIDHIYDHDTGEIYWEDTPHWSDVDETLVDSILMYGDLESVIGVY